MLTTSENNLFFPFRRKTMKGLLKHDNECNRRAKGNWKLNSYNFAGYFEERSLEKFAALWQSHHHIISNMLVSQTYDRSCQNFVTLFIRLQAKYLMNNLCFPSCILNIHHIASINHATVWKDIHLVPTYFLNFVPEAFHVLSMNRVRVTWIYENAIVFNGKFI